MSDKEYCPEYVERLEKAAEKLSCILQRIGGSYEIAEDMRKEHNEALDLFFEIKRDFGNE